MPRRSTILILLCIACGLLLTQVSASFVYIFSPIRSAVPMTKADALAVLMGGWHKGADSFNEPISGQWRAGVGLRIREASSAQAAATEFTWGFPLPVRRGFDYMGPPVTVGNSTWSDRQHHTYFAPLSPPTLATFARESASGKLLLVGWLANTAIYTALVAMVVLGASFMRRRRRARRGLCEACAYPVTGLDRCPECGRVKRSSARTERAAPSPE